MPQFYPRDNLDSWFTMCFTEHYESLDESDAKTFAFEVIEESEHLERAEEFLRNSNIGNAALVDAIVNSVDWDDVLERFKKAIDYNEDIHDCAVCNEKQDKEYSTCCEECGLLTCEDCLKVYSGACCRCGDEKEGSIKM